MVSEPNHSDRTASGAAAVTGAEGTTGEGGAPYANRNPADAKRRALFGFKEGGVGRSTADPAAIRRADSGQAIRLIKNTSSAKKGQSLAFLAAHIRRTQADIDPLRSHVTGSLAHWTAIRRTIESEIDISAALGTFRNDRSDAARALRRALANLQEHNGIIANASPQLRRAKASLGGTIRRRSRSIGKPLIEQIKAPMSSEQAQAISERLNASDRPHRKLPPRP
ncbi:hypothetical protein [Streptomyces afghaniensis]|uniref:hypothetical protein n=1 Tax=Streptomyces afghaniensis TaxID=66865 RepID=UPI0027D79665|nr:hypothetical protein [Streptomyces afghaniensis]